MSKNVIVTDGNYKITVPDNNSIVLDTGTSVGTVEITRNLLVLGTQTTVNSATLEIDDRPTQKDSLVGIFKSIVNRASNIENIEIFS